MINTNKRTFTKEEITEIGCAVFDIAVNLLFSNISKDGIRVRSFLPIDQLKIEYKYLETKYGFSLDALVDCAVGHVHYFDGENLLAYREDIEMSVYGERFIKDIIDSLDSDNDE